MQFKVISVTYRHKRRRSHRWAMHLVISSCLCTSRIKSATSCGHFSMRILISRRISFFCSFLIVITACDGTIPAAAVGMVRAELIEPAPDCARTCFANSRANVMITTFERDVAINVKAVRAVRHVSVFGVKIPLSTLKETMKMIWRRSRQRETR